MIVADNEHWSLFSNGDIAKALVIAIPFVVGLVFAAWQVVKMLWQVPKLVVEVARELKPAEPPLPEARIHKDRDVR